MKYSKHLSEMEQMCTQSFIWDAHAGIFPDPKINLDLLDAWRENSVDYVSINVGFDVMDWQQTIATLAAYRNWILANDDRFILVNKIDDVENAKKEGKLVVSFDIEGMNALNGDINMVDLYHRLGVRQMLFAYNLNNEAAGGCHDDDIGLTSFGKAIVEEMNRIGIVIDCSHTSFKTTMDIMSHTSKPVVFSHSNPSAIWKHQRNITDEQIKACAETGGVVGVNGMGIFLGDNDIATDTILRHICYLSDLVGTEHVGFGFDYSPQIDIDVGAILASRPDFWPAGNSYDAPGIKHAGPTQFIEICAGLTDHGFSISEIKGMLGENFKRVATIVWH
jgi:membrane dipeptidase